MVSQASLAAMLLLGLVPPLTDAQRARLEAAHDDRDHQDEAFVALLEHVRTWTGPLGDAPIRLHPDLDAMVADPDGSRGDLCRVSGTLQQQSWLAPPHGTVCEWFVRDDRDRPILVYVAGLDEGAGFRDGARVEIIARFYKRVMFTARDGRRRAYAAFVGARPRRLGAAPADASMWLLVGPIVVMFITFLLLLAYVRRAGGRAAARRALGPTEEEHGSGLLPEDPAEALAELHRRAGREGSGS